MTVLSPRPRLAAVVHDGKYVLGHFIGADLQSQPLAGARGKLQLQIARIVRGFGNAPRYAEFVAVFLLAPHGEPTGLFQKAS